MKCVTQSILGVLLAFGISVSCLAVTYTPVDLGIFPGGGQSFALFVSDSRQIVGYGVNSNGYERAFRYTTNGGFQPLGTLGGNFSIPNAQSPSGAFIVGHSQTTNGADHAFRWNATNGMVDLGDFGGGISSALGVDGAGRVVGFAYNSNSLPRAFLWTNGVLVDLGAFAGGASRAFSISADGTIVGESEVSPGVPHAFRYTAASGMVDLGTLVGNRSDAQKVSSTGIVIGRSSTQSLPNSIQQACLWDSTNGILSLGTIGGDISFPKDINSSGDIVGYCQDGTGYLRPFLWTLSGGMANLGTLGSTDLDSQATDINEVGHIVGFVELAGGARKAFLYKTNIAELSGLSGGSSYASTLTDNGWIVGASEVSGVFHACLWRPATPVELINSLVSSVISLNLSRGIQNSLDAKLDAAIHALDDANASNNMAAVSSLNNFINAVENQRGNQITNAEADSLIAKAQEILALL